MPWCRTHLAPNNSEFDFPKQLFLDFIEEHNGKPHRLPLILNNFAPKTVALSVRARLGIGCPPPFLSPQPVESVVVSNLTLSEQQECIPMK